MTVARRRLRNRRHTAACGRAFRAAQERKKMQSPTARDAIQGPPPLPHSAATNGSAPQWRGTPATTALTSAPHWFAPAVTAAGGWMRQVPSWLASMLIHMTALLVVASISLHVAHSIQPSVVVTTPSEPVQFDEATNKSEADARRPPIDLNAPAGPPDFEPSPSMAPEVGGPPSLVPLNPWANDPNPGPPHVDLHRFGGRKAPPTDLMKTAGVPGGTAIGFGGRFGQAKSEQVKRAGGSPESELAVADALKWLSIHQLPDGGWNFD